MFKRATLLTMLMSLVLATGCTTVQKWSAGGAVVGAGVGAVLGEKGHGMSTFQAALVGASGGGLLGALIGDQLEGNRVADLQAQIGDLEKQLADANNRNQSLQDELNNLKAELERLRNQPQQTAGIGEQSRITIAADVLFRPGSAQLSEQGRQELDRAVEQIRGNNNFIQIEGHTDTQPIRVSNWKSNWELGAARSLTVLHYLIEKGIEPSRLSAATFGEYQPVGSDLAQNRRAVIVLYDGWRAAEVQRAQNR